MTYGSEHIGLAAALATTLALTACGDVVVGDFSLEREDPFVVVAVGAQRRIAVSTDSGLTWPVDEADGASESPALNAVHYADGWFVAVGGSQNLSHIERSADGLSWAVVEESDNAELFDLTHTGERWVAVGAKGKIFTSPNAADWSLQALPLAGPALRGVASDGGQRLLAVGEGDVVASFDGGQNWSIEFDDGAAHSAVAFGNSATLGERFVVVDESGEVHVAAPELTSWSSSAQPADELHGILWAEGAFWASGSAKVLRSTDAANWETYPVAGAGAIRDLAALDGVFVGIGGGLPVRSEDGLSWSSTPSEGGEGGALLHGVALAPASSLSPPE